ncbi:MAG: gamma-glutamylcyclotransferase family protein [Syntrophobacteraceae bacterium]
MLYFAYGSNLDWDQMQQRCPSVKFYGVAVLPDHKLAFTRYSKGRDCGVADAMPGKNSSVWGVIYAISDQDISPLDRSEGFRQGRAENYYVRRAVRVLLNGSVDSPLSVSIYFATREPYPHLPSKEYKDLILNGAMYWKLPNDYIQAVLEPIQVKE